MKNNVQTRTKELLMWAALLVVPAICLTGCPAQDGSAQEADPGSGAIGTSEEPVEPDRPDGPVRIAFVPSVEMGAIEMELEEFDRELSEMIGHPVESAIVLTYAACIEQMAAGHFEAALLPSLAYVLANDRYGVEVALKAVRRGSPTYRGQIVVRADSDIEELEDLRGRTFGFTDVPSASGHLYPRAFLISQGIDPDTDLDEVTFIGSHPMVVEAVLTGRIDAGACFDDARLRLVDTEPEVMEEVRVLAYTPDIPSDTFSLRADCEGEFYDRLVEAVIELSKKGEEGVLFRIYEIEEFVPAEDRDYDPIRQMASILDLDLEAELE